MNTLTCIEFRQRIGAEPMSRDPGLVRHRLACRTCAEHARGLEVMDLRLMRALALPVPETLAHRIILRASSEAMTPPGRRWHALAAMLGLLAVGIAAGLLWRTPEAVATPLSVDALAHLHHEPDTHAPTAVQVAHTRVREVLVRGGAEPVDLDALGAVSYARLCPFRGHLVPHLVFQGADGPVTVFVLKHERVSGPTSFAEGGWRGVILPTGTGSIAIIGVDEPSLQEVRERVTRSVSISI